MQFIKVKFLKSGKAAGRGYTYRSPVEVKPGDKVELPGGKYAVVVDEPIDAAWIQAYGADKVKQIIGKVEEKSDGKQNSGTEEGRSSEQGRAAGGDCGQ